MMTRARAGHGAGTCRALASRALSILRSAAVAGVAKASPSGSKRRRRRQFAKSLGDQLVGVGGVPSRPTGAESPGRIHMPVMLGTF